MKIMIASLLLGLLGAGSYQLVGSAPATQCTQDCNATVRCTPDGTCRITCDGPDGQKCWVELACDGGQCRVVASNCSAKCSAERARACSKACAE